MTYDEAFSKQFLDVNSLYVIFVSLAFVAQFDVHFMTVKII